MTLQQFALGLVLAVGAFLVVTPPSPPSPNRVRRERLRVLLAEAGYPRWTPVQVVTASVGLAVTTFLLFLGISGSFAVSLVFALLAGAAPVNYLRHRRRRRGVEFRELWPDVIDNLSSGVRAGMSLPEALGQVAHRGPEQLRPSFRRFSDEYRVSGRFGDALDLLKHDLADPVGDRIVESLRIARDVGGHDLGRLLRTLSTFLRDDLRTRGEIRSRQSWTVNAARLAVAAPWILLVMLSLRPQAVAAYDSSAGVIILVVGAAISVFAYRLMLRIARLPIEERVLR